MRVVLFISKECSMQTLDEALKNAIASMIDDLEVSAAAAEAIECSSDYEWTLDDIKHYFLRYAMKSIEDEDLKEALFDLYDLEQHDLENNQIMIEALKTVKSTIIEIAMKKS
jgi:hypothetical protein